MTYQIYDLFPTPLLTHKNFLPQEYLEQVQNVVINSEFIDSNNSKYEIHPTVSKNILKSLPIIKEEIMETFKEYARNVLRINFDTDFVMGSSWGTMTKPGEESSPHTHSNYYYSGCYYISDEPSAIHFSLGPSVYNYHERFMLRYIDNNVYNNNKIVYHPEKNEIIFFPAYLKHQISRNESDTNRYSVAFNIHPTGYYGLHDSQIHIQVIDDLD
jgi:uncharacterized protein (TIGR02466 family)